MELIEKIKKEIHLDPYEKEYNSLLFFKLRRHGCGLLQSIRYVFNEYKINKNKIDYRHIYDVDLETTTIPDKDDVELFIRIAEEKIESNLSNLFILECIHRNPCKLDEYFNILKSCRKELIDIKKG